LESERYTVLDHRRNKDILEEIKVYSFKKKLAHYEDKWLNHVSRMEDKECGR